MHKVVNNYAFIMPFVVSRACVMAGAASQAGDADSSRAPGFAGVRECPPWCSFLVPQWQCISSFVFYKDIVNLHSF